MKPWKGLSASQGGIAEQRPCWTALRYYTELQRQRLATRWSRQDRSDHFTEKNWCSIHKKKRVLPSPYPPMRVAEGPVFFSVQPFFLWNFLPLTRQGKARFSVTKGLRKAETERSALHFCRIFFRFLCRSGLCIIQKRCCAVIERQKRAFPQAIEILQRPAINGDKRIQNKNDRFTAKNWCSIHEKEGRKRNEQEGNSFIKLHFAKEDR